MTAAFRVKTPKRAENFVKNPSAEGTSDFSSSFGNVSRSTTKAREGRYAYLIQPAPTENLILDLSKTLPAEGHVMSVWVQDGVPTGLKIGATTLTPVFRETIGGWSAYEAAFSGAQCSGATTCQVQASATIYVDDVQVEAGAAATTTINGDRGFGYRWRGPAHGSASVRAAMVAGDPVWDGGLIQDLDDDVHVTIRMAVGLGVAPAVPIADERADGRPPVYRKSTLKPREAVLTVEIDGDDIADVTSIRAEMLAKLPVLKPFALLFNLGNALMEATFVYAGGLDLHEIEAGSETFALALTAHDPNWRELFETSTALALSTTSPATYFAARQEGLWQAYGAGPGGEVLTIYVAPDKTVYVGTSSISGTAYIKKWTGSAWTTVASVTGTLGGVGPAIYGMTQSVDGTKLYFVGAFTHVGGTSGYNGVGSATVASPYTAAKIPAAGTGLNDVGYGCAVDPTGTYLYIVGKFTAVNGVTAHRIARFNIGTATWSALYASGNGLGGVDLDGIARAVRVASNGDVYVGGDFGIAGKLGTASAPTGSASAGGSLTASHAHRFKIAHLTDEGESIASSSLLVWTDATNKTITINWTNPTGSRGTKIYITYPSQGSDPGAGTAHYLSQTVAAGLTSYTFSAGGTYGANVYQLDTTNGQVLAPTTDTSGTDTAGIARFDVTNVQWRDVGISGFGGGVVYDLDLFPDQTTLVAVGTFTSCDGNACGRAAYTTGGVWLPLGGTGLIGGAAYAVKRFADGRIWAAGLFTSADGNSFASRLAVFDGFPSGTWNHADIDLAGLSVWDVAELYDDVLLGLSGAVTSAAASTSVTHTGSADWRPKLVFEGVGSLRGWECYETAKRILTTHAMVAGEKVVFDADAHTLVSSVHGDIGHKVRPGCDLDSFYLPSGASSLRLHVTGADGSTSARVVGRPTNLSVDKAA
jgi:hypothetical protein